MRLPLPFLTAFEGIFDIAAGLLPSRIIAPSDISQVLRFMPFLKHIFSGFDSW